MQYREVSSVLIEGIVIGIMTVVLFLVLSLSKMNHLFLLFVTGFLIHILFEYTGKNEWWCKKTYK
jgi:hypothetical protein